jgi:KUP system potassium uptake protein
VPSGILIGSDKPSDTKRHAPRPAAHTDSVGAGHHAGNPWFLMLTALGVVYGDIGTSPLYAFQVALTNIGHPVPTRADVFGIVSLTFWALMLMVSLKYVVLVLSADNDGEGGILALLSLVAGPRVASGASLTTLVLLGVVGAALLYGDGVITPAISVLSAMEGLKLAAPSLGPVVVPVTMVILIGLFVIQRRGTEAIGRLFGPVMVLWFAVIGLLGAKSIWTAPEIVGALNPAWAASFLAADPIISFAVLGAVFLTLTGGEALYADMGHVGSAAIRRAWFGLVLPALLLNYFGQGARVLSDPSSADNPFYKLAPDWALMPLIGLATAATIIASQSLISGVFSLTRQAMLMGLSPRVRIVSTSGDEEGQIYIPAANWLLMTGTLFTVALFKTSDSLAAAYGIAVSGTMLVTTLLLYRVAVTLWAWPKPAAIMVIAAFATIDMTFLVSNSMKIIAGGWFPIVIGVTIAVLMLTWRRGASLLRRRLWDMSIPLKDFLDYADKTVIGRAPGVGVWLTKVDHGASPMLLRHVEHNRVLHETVVLLSFVPEHRPRVPFDQRHTVVNLGRGFYQIQSRLGPCRLLFSLFSRGSPVARPISSKFRMTQLSR